MSVFDMEEIAYEHGKVEEMAKEAVEDWRQYANDVINQLDSVCVPEIRLLGYFSLMECIAQDVANYQGRNSDQFINFVLKYQNKYSFLENVDPITLFYRLQDKLCDRIDLSELVDGEVYGLNDKDIQEKVNEMKTTIPDIIESSDKYLKEHKIINLLYRMRCRLSHEFSPSHTSLLKTYSEPYYINKFRVYRRDGKNVSDNVWVLNIPVVFIRNLCINCVNNYLDECLDKHCYPLPNDTMYRYCELSWYEKE